MIETSRELKVKIDKFYIRFASKEKIIVYEQSKFDIILDDIFNRLSIILLSIFKRLFNISKKMINKFFDIITQQNDLKKKILKQEKILFNISKLNADLSEQIKLLNKKIDKFSLQRNSQNLEQASNNINNNLKESKIKNQPINEIEFFQNENLRISNELFESRKKNDIMKQEVERYNKQRTDLINKINSVNEVINDSNILTSVFENNLENKKNKIFNPNNRIINTPSKEFENLDQRVKNIFSKK